MRFVKVLLLLVFLFLKEGVSKIKMIIGVRLSLCYLDMCIFEVVKI